MVGVDMEWQPTFGCSSAQQVALIQLAVSDRVFLLDVCAEGLSQHPDTVAFIRSLFSSTRVLKLGEHRRPGRREAFVFVLLLFDLAPLVWARVQYVRGPQVRPVHLAPVVSGATGDAGCAGSSSCAPEGTISISCVLLLRPKLLKKTCSLGTPATDPAQQSQQDSERLQGGAGWGSVC